MAMRIKTKGNLIRVIFFFFIAFIFVFIYLSLKEEVYQGSTEVRVQTQVCVEMCLNQR